MAFYYSAQQQQQPSHTSSHNNHHGGRSRRQPRMSSSNTHRQFRGVRSMKDLAEAPNFTAYLTKLEACRGFELEDDMEFCPDLLTEDDISSTDGSSLSSGSTSTSPVSLAAQVAAPYPANTLLGNYSKLGHHQQQQHQQQHSSTKMHQPSALRPRSAIPIVDPLTMKRVHSPPNSISPPRMQQQTYMRRW